MPVVKLYANLRKLAGTKELSVMPPSGRLRSASRETTLGAVLDELVEQKPALDGYVVENGQIRPHVVITVNGHNATELGAPVTEQDLIAIFPPIAGG